MKIFSALKNGRDKIFEIFSSKVETAGILQTLIETNRSLFRAHQWLWESIFGIGTANLSNQFFAQPFRSDVLAEIKLVIQFFIQKLFFFKYFGHLKFFFFRSPKLWDPKNFNCNRYKIN